MKAKMLYDPPDMDKSPFFILGCVRSGTTFLRNLLRRNPNLVCPEETHFYRSGEPFGTAISRNYLLNNKTLQHHRSMDGISEEQFKDILASSHSRADLYRAYMEHFKEACGKPSARWFDKTPQNVYGAAMLMNDFPTARLIHVVRNPLDVACSLQAGKILHVGEIIGASNYWNESVNIIKTVKAAYPDRVLEVRYEDFSADFLGTLKKVHQFISETFEPSYFRKFRFSAKTHAHTRKLRSENINLIAQLCESNLKEYQYDIYFESLMSDESKSRASTLKYLKWFEG